MDATKLFRDALREATDCSVETIARQAGFSRSSFDTYLNRRPPSTAAIRALAGVLEARADRMQSHADDLREAAGDGSGGGDSA